MTIEEAIQKAIEGGWKADWYFDESAKPVHGDYVLSAKVHFTSMEMQYGDTLLDPAFWQSLGKAMGWPEEVDNAGETTDGKKWHQTTTLGSWLNNWHLFIEFLAEGKTAESFFATLT